MYDYKENEFLDCDGDSLIDSDFYDSDDSDIYCSFVDLMELNKSRLEVKSYHDMFSQTTSSGGGARAPFLSFVRTLPRPTLLLLISTGLLILLFASATVLLYRIARLHQTPIDFSSRSMSEVHAYINSNLEHITKVRESLEKLSTLIEHGGKYHS